MSDQASLIKTVEARAFCCIFLVMLGTSLSVKDRQTDRPTDRGGEEQKKIKRKRVEEEPLSEEAPRHQYISSNPKEKT